MGIRNKKRETLRPGFSLRFANAESRRGENPRLKINQICRWLSTEIEKSKKFLSPFLTSTYENRESRIDLYFRLKRAG
jgi:hypothetical protein